MKNKKVLIGICVVFVAIAFISIYQFTKGREEKDIVIAPEDAVHMTVDAKIDEYYSLKEIEDKVDIIVKVRKDSEESPIIRRDEMGDVYFAGTIGNVKVIQLYTNKSVQSIDAGDIIPVFENEAYILRQIRYITLPKLSYILIMRKNTK